jgi:hypothetical protein
VCARLLPIPQASCASPASTWSTPFARLTTGHPRTGWTSTNALLARTRLRATGASGQTLLVWRHCTFGGRITAPVLQCYPTSPCGYRTRPSGSTPDAALQHVVVLRPTTIALAAGATCAALVRAAFRAAAADSNAWFRGHAGRRWPTGCDRHLDSLLRRSAERQDPRYL